MEDHRRPTDVSLVFPAHPLWVRTARETVRTLLAASHRPELTDIAVLLTSEAVTNAVKASAGWGRSTPVTLLVGWSGPRRFRVLVHDEAPGFPGLRTPGADEEGGRGLQLISNRADAWGVCGHGPGWGKATWFELGRADLAG